MAFLPGLSAAPPVAAAAGVDLADLIVVDRIDVTTRWASVEFVSPFSEAPVVVAGPVSWVGRDPTTIRVRNVTATGFEVRLTEWPYLDGHHTVETVSYLALPAGLHTLASGAVVEAGVMFIPRGYGLTQVLSEQFGERPAVLSTVVVSGPAPALAARTQAYELSGQWRFTARLQAEEADAANIYPPGTINWVAWSQGSDDGMNDGVAWQVQHKAINNSFTGFTFDRAYVRPCVLADMITYNGGDTANLRYRRLRVRSVRLRIDEEKSADAEVAHTNERVGLVVVECAKNPPVPNVDFAFGATLVGMPTVLSGWVHDNAPVVRVSIAIRHRASGDWLQRDGTFGPAIRRFDAELTERDFFRAPDLWSYSVELPDGDYSLSVRVLDADGNEVPLSPWRHFSVLGMPTASGRVLAAADGLTSIQLDTEGSPVIAYSHEGLAKVIHCSDPDCADFSGPHAAGPAPTPPLDWEEWEALDLELDGAGNPVIAAGGAVIHCIDPNCEQAASVEDFGVWVESPSLELDAVGNPVVSSGYGLKLMHCVDPNCAETPVFGYNFEPNEVRWTSLALDASGNPVIATWDWYGGRDGLAPLLLTHCADPNCQAPSSQVMLESGYWETDKAVAMVLDGSGNPVIVAKQSNPEEDASDRVRVIRCTDPNCFGPFSTNWIEDDRHAGMHSSLGLSPTGLPVVAYNLWSIDQDLMLARCTDASCADPPHTVIVDNDNVVARWVSMAVDDAGTAYISYYDANEGDLRFARVPAP